MRLLLAALLALAIAGCAHHAAARRAALAGLYEDKPGAPQFGRVVNLGQDGLYRTGVVLRLERVEEPGRPWMMYGAMPGGTWKAIGRSIVLYQFDDVHRRYTLAERLAVVWSDGTSSWCRATSDTGAGRMACQGPRASSRGRRQSGRPGFDRPGRPAVGSSWAGGSRHAVAVITRSTSFRW